MATDTSTEADTVAIAATERPFEVFVSYRVDPDQPLAGALKQLIETAISPPPRVFVSGLGGIRPSNRGFKPQIQAAAQSASAFVAIITQQSKDREWLFFEAGSAWGRGQLYTPLLIDTLPSDLASSIADFQAIKASDITAMEILLREIAAATGGDVKNYLRRFRVFRGKVEEFIASAQLKSGGENDEQSPGVKAALDLIAAGDETGGAAALDQIIEAETDPERIVSIRVLQITSGDRSSLKQLHELEAVVRAVGPTRIGHLWLGLLDQRPMAAIRHYEKCMEACGEDVLSYVYIRAQTALFVEYIRLNDWENAYATARCALKIPSFDLRNRLVSEWLIYRNKIQSEPYETLLWFMIGILDEHSDDELYAAAIGHMVGNDWMSLALNVGRSNALSSGSVANRLGSVYSQLNMYSLSYLAFAEAMDSGVSVAKVNVAASTLHRAVPAVGLKILRDHVGEFDAFDPGYPYETRAELERAVDKEETEAQKISEVGRVNILALANFAWQALEGDTLPIGKTFEAGSHFARIEGTREEPQLVLDGVAFSGETVGTVFRFMKCVQDERVVLCTLCANGDLHVVDTVLTGKGESPKSYLLKPVSADTE